MRTRIPAAAPRPARFLPRPGAAGHHGSLPTLYRSDEPIPPPRKRFYEARAFRRITQYLANPVNRSIQIVIDINKSVRPQSRLQFLPGHYLPGRSSRMVRT